MAQTTDPLFRELNGRKGPVCGAIVAALKAIHADDKI